LQTWYKMFGSTSPGNPPPLVVLHGGPGSHDYMIPISDIASFPAHRPVIFYDQMGNGQSTHLRSKDHGFWTIDLFIDELVNLLSHFKIIDNFDLLGHSWGGMLAAEFIIRRQPSGIKHLVLANSLASTRLRNIAVARLERELPINTQAALRECSAVGDTSSEKFKSAKFDYYKRFLCRIEPMPEPILFSLEQNQKNPTVLVSMQRYEINQNWDITSKMHLIQVPTLLINGEYDFETDDVCAPFFRGIDRIKWVKFAESSHMPHWEERERYMEVVESFLVDT